MIPERQINSRLQRNEPENSLSPSQHPHHGLKDIQRMRETPKNRILASLFLELLFESNEEFLTLCNQINQIMRESRDHRARAFSPEAILIGLVLFIGACEFD